MATTSAWLCPSEIMGPIPLASWEASGDRGDSLIRPGTLQIAGAGAGRDRGVEMGLVNDGPYRFRIPQRGQMRVPGIVYASGELIPDLAADRCLEQVANVATLPGIVTASYAMPDLHLGYGFPIGGVAATDPAAGGVVSPGGVGFDISCGVRLLAASLERSEVMPVLGTLMDQLAAAVPRGRAGAASGIWPARGSCGT
jgi:tRNA-splicing ligase RtcB